MLAHEREVRDARDATVEDSKGDAPGYDLQRNPEEHLASIHVHPEADSWFFETVAGACDE